MIRGHGAGHTQGCPHHRSSRPSPHLLSGVHPEEGLRAASKEQLSSALVPTCQARPWKFLSCFPDRLPEKDAMPGGIKTPEGGWTWAEEERSLLKGDIPSQAHGSGAVTRSSGALGPLFPGVHHTQIQGSNDMLSTWSEGILFLP